MKVPSALFNFHLHTHDNSAFRFLFAELLIAQQPSILIVSILGLLPSWRPPAPHASLYVRSLFLFLFITQTHKILKS